MPSDSSASITTRSSDPVPLETPEKVLAVPKIALLSDEGKHFVFRMVRDGFALRTDVEPGREFADSVEITCGLQEGAQIATVGLQGIARQPFFKPQRVGEGIDAGIASVRHYRR